MVSVCVSVCQKSELNLPGGWSWFWQRRFLFYKAYVKGISKNKDSFSGTLSQTVDLEKFVDRNKLTILATVGVRPTTLASLSHRASTIVYSKMRERQRVARVHLRQLILVTPSS